MTHTFHALNLVISRFSEIWTLHIIDFAYYQLKKVYSPGSICVNRINTTSLLYIGTTHSRAIFTLKVSNIYNVKLCNFFHPTNIKQLMRYHQRSSTAHETSPIRSIWARPARLYPGRSLPARITLAHRQWPAEPTDRTHSSWLDLQKSRTHSVIRLATRPAVLSP